MINPNSSSEEKQTSALSMPLSEGLHDEFSERGVSPITSILPKELLTPLQEKIYVGTKHLIVPHSDGLSLEERLRLPFAREATPEEFSTFMRSIDNCSEVRAIIESNEIRQFFEAIFGTDRVHQFPISRFRAQFPTLKRSAYDWHQDEGTWYAIKQKELAGKLPATCWLSINGSTKQNSIEIIPYSHLCKLIYHRDVAGQGRFSAEPPAHLDQSQNIVIETQPGEGVAFHALTFHRSVMNPTNSPRYSIDIRFYSELLADTPYSTEWRFKFHRFFS